MNPDPAPSSIRLSPSSRREFLKTSSKIAAVSALAGVVLPHVHAQGSDVLQVALVGCGGRGTGAAADALSATNGRLQLVAMADVFEDKLKNSFDGLQKQFPNQIDVPPDRKFIGFDSYKQALDSLKPGAIAIFTTPPAFRWVHFKYAIEKRLNVFMEKPITVDAPTTKRMMALADEADKKNLKVGVGLMVRHCRARQALKQRIDDGEIGDIITMRAYRLQGPGGSAFTKAMPPGQNETLYQIRNFHSFLWASGGLFSDFNIHQVDETCWMKGSWPVRATATGGRNYRGDFVDQNFDNYNIEYIFEDGARLHFTSRVMSGCHNDFSSYVHGSKGIGVVSATAHTPGKCKTFKGHTLNRANMIWEFPQPEKNPYRLEWEDLVDAIKNNKPYNEVKRGAMASVVTSMGRMAAHTGKVVELSEYMEHDHEFAPGLDTLTKDSPAPLQKNANGLYPIPRPGIVTDREY